MILPEPQSRFISQLLINRIQKNSYRKPFFHYYATAAALSLAKPVELDYHFVEFDDIRYHVQATVKDPQHMSLSISIPPPPPETVFSGGLPFGAIEAVRGAYGSILQIVDPAKDGFQLTLKLDLTKLPSDEEKRSQLITKVSMLRSIVLGAPLRELLKHLAFKKVAPNADRLVALTHCPGESFYALPQPEKVTVIFPMRFKDSNDVVLGTSFLQEFMEARRTSGLNAAPLCHWSESSPLELKGAPSHVLNANAGFASFVIFPRHVEGVKLDRTVWNLLTFHAYVSYHIKCTKSFMHTRMRRQVENLIQALNRAKPNAEKVKKTAQNHSFGRQL